MTYKFNKDPEKGSRPMSASASGFVPGSGAGALMLESLESARQRGASIYAEVLGGTVNSGGQRQGGTLTAPNSKAVQTCIREALHQAQVQPEEVDLINGHLTATSKDPVEIENWATALHRYGKDFPYINATKSMIGHCLAAAGSIESVATVLQLHEQYVAPNINCEDLHPAINELISQFSVPFTEVNTSLDIAVKASFGFGDVNACVLFKKFP
jgi:3-oxoacyl-(acyl-carrier-protein) synthase